MGSGTTVNFASQWWTSNGNNNKGCSVSSDNEGAFLVSYRRQSNSHAHRVTKPTGSTANVSSDVYLTNWTPADDEHAFASVYCPSVKAWLGMCMTGGNLKHFWVNKNSGNSAPTISTSGNTFIANAKDPQMSWDSTNNQVILTYIKTSNNRGYVLTLTVSANEGKIDGGNTVGSFSDPVVNTELQIENHDTLLLDHAFVKTNNQVAVLIGRQSSNKTHVNVYNISGTSITTNSGQPAHEYVIAMQDYNYGAIDCLTSKARLVIAIKEDNNSDRFMMQTIDVPEVSTNLTAENFVGFADAGYSNGATATISVVGSTTTQSGLTPGQKYFVQGDGTLGLTADDPSVDAGLALSSTSLLIK